AQTPSAAEEVRQQQALEDLIVQTEIFLQYSLHAKAQERLQKIAAMFPGEEERNARLRTLYETANWWPQGTQRSKPAPKPAALPEVPATPSGPKTGVYAADTLRDPEHGGQRSRSVLARHPHPGGNRRPRAAARTGRGVLCPGRPARPGSASGSAAGANGKSGAG